MKLQEMDTWPVQPTGLKDVADQVVVVGRNLTVLRLFAARYAGGLTTASVFCKHTVHLCHYCPLVYRTTTSINCVLGL